MPIIFISCPPWMHKCIACAMCAMVCPFDAVTFHPNNTRQDQPRVVAIKCDGCLDRLRQKKTPACVEACQTNALVFGELNDLIKAGRMQQSPAAINPDPTSSDPAAGWRDWGIVAAAMAEKIA
uniref:4Fe-4S dicluster domain-containing protein n=1 Tax=Candidatus Kentrum sp. SD TaxID=2126332 RepID=A0A451BSM8_9GAMM|nr:MAG: 4Fe-4S dicluster domain-containing protein [Candidatus Kentron sp. SD]